MSRQGSDGSMSPPPLPSSRAHSPSPSSTSPLAHRARTSGASTPQSQHIQLLSTDAHLRRLTSAINTTPSPSPSSTYARAMSAKRRWEDATDDDISLAGSGSVAGTEDSRASYNTRRQRVWRANHKASTRAAARLRHKPVFNHIRVDTVPDFHRHYKPGFSFAPPDPLVQEFVELHGVPTPSCDKDNLCFMTPCDDVQMNHLKHFDRPPRQLNPKYSKQYQLALTAVAQMLKLDQKLIFPHAEDLETVRFKARKFPGAYYRNMGFQSRIEAQEVALVDAKLAFAQLLSGVPVDPHTVRLGGRGKAVGQSEASARAAGVPKGRLILMLSQRDLLLCGVTEQLLTAAYCPDQFPISLGMGWFKGNVRRFSERYAGMKKFFCFDAAKFDSSLDDYMIRDVVDILRHQFINGMDDRYDEYWEFVIQSLIYAPIQRDDGYLMFKSVGTTSGHNHNTLIQSICSLIIAYTNYFAVLPDTPPQLVVNDAAVETLGDDNLTGSEGLLMDVTVEQVSDVSMDAFGQDYYGDKSFATTKMLDMVEDDETFTEEGKFQGLQYLGKFLRSYNLETDTGTRVVALPYRPCHETFVHMYYPERKSTGVDRTYQRALGNLLDNYGNPLMAKWLNKFLDWLEEKMEILPTMWLEDTVQDAARDYTATQVRVPRPQRWTFEDWVFLCLNDRDDDPELYMYA